MTHATVRWTGHDGRCHSGGLDDLERALNTGSCWVDIGAEVSEGLERLAGPLGLHPLAIEDALHPQARPKLDSHPDGLFLVWLTPHLSDEGELTFEELNVFLTDKALVTVHDGSVGAIDDVISDAQRLLTKGNDWVLHAILDRLVDSMLTVADEVGYLLEDLEDRMLSEPTQADLERLYLLRRQLLTLHRVVSPERDILRSLSRERGSVSEDVYRYFNDVIDHLMRVEESLETYRDIASAVMDIYLSAQSNRLNEIMKVLTVVTVLIGALTLVSGIYGMNLLGGMWPPPEAVWSFPSAMTAMVALAALMAVYFRRKHWW